MPRFWWARADGLNFRYVGITFEGNGRRALERSGQSMQAVAGVDISNCRRNTLTALRLRIRGEKFPSSLLLEHGFVKAE
ncbi:hypothetical protein, partial [Ferrimicrobium sp.]|uniref:hypothetical protein n=1 Tax=Ferrimicrobium sp. TaxID=2926050 RepID=UPI00262C7D80